MAGGACVAGGVCVSREGVRGNRGVHGRRDGHCSERYASYWNAFLFKAVLTIVVNYVFAIEFSRIYTKLPMLGLNDYMGYSKNI